SAYANLETVEDVFTIGINRAVTVIAEKKAKGPGGRGAAATHADLDEHADVGTITVRDGRYGPYVNWGKINATLRKGKDPASVSQPEALELIAAKAGSKGGKKKPARAKAKPKARKSKD